MVDFTIVPADSGAAPTAKLNGMSSRALAEGSQARVKTRSGQCRTNTRPVSNPALSRVRCVAVVRPPPQPEVMGNATGADEQAAHGESRRRRGRMDRGAGNRPLSRRPP